MSDLISRKDVLHELGLCDYGLKDWQKWKLKMMVRDIPLAQSEQRWIPCSERLPEKGLRVLMQLNNAWQLVGWYDKEDKQWYALPFSQEVVNDCVLAWMPLPEDYEESEEKQ